MDPGAPVETQDVQFKQTSPKDICSNLNQIPECSSLIVNDDKRGLLYIGHDSCLSIVKSEDVTNPPWKVVHNLNQAISRLSISCDGNYVGVTFQRSTARIYKAESLHKNQLELIGEIQLSAGSNNAIALDFQWNPATAGMFVTISSDCWIGMFQMKENEPGKHSLTTLGLEKPNNIDATCVCWSPKGKQIAVGTKNGNIVQLKPELKVARTIGGPGEAYGEVLSILWISNYQFCTAYVERNERRVNVIIVDAPKGEQIGRFTCYDDITYGMAPMDSFYSPTYYFIHVAEWNMIIASSNHSFEIALLASENGSTWVQWMQPSEVRALLPLQKTEQTFPLGLTLSKSSTTKLPWTDNTFLENPVPLLHIFATSGQVFNYYMVNLLPTAPAICSPPSQPVNESRSSLGPAEISFHLNAAITSTPRQVSKPLEPPVEKPKPAPTVNPVNLFADSAKAPVSMGLTVPNVTVTPVASNQTIKAALEAKSSTIPTEKVVVPETKVEERASPKESPKEPVKEAPADKIFLDDAICMKAYQEEKMHFEKELKAKLEPMKWEIGSKEEWQKLINQTAEVEEFQKDLCEATTSLSGEIVYLKHLLLQSFAWVEETKSRNSSNRKSDRHDRSKIQELKRMVELTQSQLMQAVKALDLVWIESENHEKSKLRTPNLEFIYQSLKKHSEIITKEKNILDKQMKRCQLLFNTNVMNSLNKSISKLNISSVDNDIDGKAIQMRCKLIAENTRNFSREKQNILRDNLAKTKLKKIKAISPTAVQGKLEATLSSLASLTGVSPPETPAPSVVKPREVLTKEKKPVGKDFPESAPFLFQPAPVSPAINTQKPSPVAPKSPLDSLNNIIAQIGNLSSPDMASTKPAAFFQSDKVQMTFNKSPTLKPSAGDIGSTLSKASNLSFGFGDTLAASTTTKESPKPNFTFKLKDNAAQASPQAVTNLFKTNLFDSTPVSSSASLPALNFSLKDVTPATTSQQNLFSFTNPAVSIAKPSVSAQTTTVSSVSSSFPTFSFSAKPFDSTPAVSEAPKPAIDLNKISLNMNQPEKSIVPPTSSVAPVSTATSTIPVTASTPSFSFNATPAPSLNFAAAVSTPPATVTNVHLPPGTSIEKVPTTSTFPSTGSVFGNQPATTSAPSIFGGSNSSGSLVFGNVTSVATITTATTTTTTTAAATITSASIFGGTSSGFAGTTNQSSIFGTSTPFSFANPPKNENPTQEKLPTTNFFQGSTPAPNQTPTPFSPQPATTVSGDFSTSFSNLMTPNSNINFGKPPSGSIFGKSALTTSPTPATNIFGASAATSPPAKVPETPAQNIFGAKPTQTNTLFGSPATTSASIFGGAPLQQNQPFGVATQAPTVAFGQSPPAFSTSPKPQSMFGAAPTFGAAATFGGAPTFGSTSPGFGGVPASNTFGGFRSPGFQAQPAQAFSTAGNSTFESLAGQNNGLTFGSLAQKTASPEKPPSFNPGSSFSSWR